MRHRRRGRKLGRNPSHRRAMLRNLASSLFLTERDAEFDSNAPATKGRVITTLHKAKEVRPLVEKCITIARHSLQHAEAADEYGTDARRGSEEWKIWRSSDQWRQWCDARAPAIAARRRVLQLLGDKYAVRVLFEEIAPRFADRDGGYTRVMRLAAPRLGDGGTRAILELVGVHDRIALSSEKPSFADDMEESAAEEDSIGAEDSTPGADATPGDPEAIASDQSDDQPVADNDESGEDDGAKSG